MVEEIRALSKAYRSRNKDDLPMIGAAIAENALALPEYKSANTVFAFCSTPLEPDTMPLLLKILEDGKTLGLPLCESEGVMTARKVYDLSQLREGAFGIMAPSSEARILEPSDIDLVFVPCSAMDRRGGRIGKGGGYYDRFLQNFCGSMAALCPEELLFDMLPQQPHDVKIPVIVTECGVVRAFD